MKHNEFCSVSQLSIHTMLSMLRILVGRNGPSGIIGIIVGITPATHVTGFCLPAELAIRISGMRPQANQGCRTVFTWAYTRNMHVMCVMWSATLALPCYLLAVL